MHFRFIFRHIVRAPLKSILPAAVALLFVVALGWFQMTIERTAEELDYLRHTLPIEVEIRRLDYDAFQPIHDAPMDNVLSHAVITTIMQNEFVMDYYLLAGFPWYNLIAAGADGQFEMTILEEIWYNPVDDWIMEVLDWHFATNCIYTLAEESGRSHADIHFVREDFEIWFGEGFSADDFVHDAQDTETPIPLVVHTDILERRNLNVGDAAFITHNMSNMAFFYRPAVVIGAYSGPTIGGVLHRRDLPYVILPVSGLESIRRTATGFTLARFAIDPARNHEIQYFIDEISTMLARNSVNVAAAGGTFVTRIHPLRAIVLDEDFRNVVQPMEANLNLMRTLYPVAIATALIIGFGLSLLLMLQNAKNAAILRVLGNTKAQTGLVLNLGQMAAIIAAIPIAFAILLLLSDNPANFLPPGLAYLIMAILGGLAGAIIINNRSPLELLQTRE
ncbi:MAG: hypothetical protein LBE35_05515 [Clostridiales bacterium]|jgi:hypothetical protein|nr:hypothetical protein [Clostridiales bacterium]